MLDEFIEALKRLFDSLRLGLVSYENAKRDLQTMMDTYYSELSQLSLPPSPSLPTETQDDSM